MWLLKDMKGSFREGGGFFLWLMSLVLIGTAFASPFGTEDLPQGTVQPWEEALQHIKPKATPEEQEAAVRGLAKRLLKDRADDFSFEVRAGNNANGKDVFQITSPGVNASVEILATTGVAASWGLLHYLKYYCNAHVSWEADQLSLPTVLPPADFTIVANDWFRYYQNVCTVSYSMSWWDWSRWEREIDWMALNGINIPLAFTGQEAIWQRVYTKLGVTQKELDEHFVGPAFLAWGRMGNIRGWGGPLTDSWHNKTVALQHQILERMRQFGITPILPAFAGHVPAGLARVFPDAKITRLGGWARFNCTYSCTYLLDPTDPLFEKIGAAFVKELTSEFGTDHLYNCDTFNEMTPSSSDPAYLKSVGTAVFEAMTAADPDAIWVMQGWIFFKDPTFWDKEHSRALLTSVPLGRMLVLDLASEMAPQYSRLESYFGQPFIFCMLHNYGGVDGFYGNVDVLLKNMVAARQFPNVTLVGTGLTPEGINQNYMMYDLMNELAWRTTTPNMTSWAASYASRRYGSSDSRLGDAWQLLIRSVYNCQVFFRYHGRNVVVMQRPRLKPRHFIWYSKDDVVKAWDLVIDVIKDAEVMKIEQERTGRRQEREDDDDDQSEESEEESEEEEEGVVKQQLAHEPLLLLPAARRGNPGKQRLIRSVDTLQPQSPPDIEWRRKSQGRSIKRILDHSPGRSGNDGVNDQNEGDLISYSQGEMKRQETKSPNVVRNSMYPMKRSDTTEDNSYGRQMGSVVTLPVTTQATFQHDVVDITRQILQILGGEIVLRMLDFYKQKDILGVQNDTENVQMILKDLDDLLATSPDFLIGTWTESAAAWATNEKERELYLYNALNQVTLWGPDGEIADYAIKQWSGLIANYAAPRWDAFGKQLVDCLQKGISFDQNAFQKSIFQQVEEPFSKDVNVTYPSEPTGDTIATALRLHEKYRPFFEESLQDSWQQRKEKLLLPSRRPIGLPKALHKKRQQQQRVRGQKVNKLVVDERQEKETHENSIWNLLRV